MNRAPPTLLAALLLAACLAGIARADQLRNVKPGQAIPPFSVTTLEGKQITGESLRGRVTVLVFVSAKQRSSESAALSAHRVVERLRRPQNVTLLFATADVVETKYFREERDRTSVHEPLGLDFDRRLYGALGLIVLPTTVVIDAEGRLAHVISGYKSDYEHVLRAYVRHALGALDDAALARELEAGSFRRDLPEHKVARHRAAARHMRSAGLLDSAEAEIHRALEIDPDHVEARLDLAAVCLAQDRTEEATTIIDEILAEAPSQRRAKLLHGVALYELGRLDEAEAVLTEALLLNPDPVHTHYYLGLVYEKKGDVKRALEHYRQSIARLIDDRPL